MQIVLGFYFLVVLEKNYTSIKK